MSNPITSIKLYQSYGYGHSIYWTIDPVFREADPHNFTLEASGTPDFSEILYSIPVGNSFVAVDNTNNKQSSSLDLYYRVKLETGENNTYYSEVIAFVGPRYNRREYVIAREIVRKELVRMTKFTGTEMVLLKRKIHGSESTGVEVDPVSGVPLTDQPSGYNTRFFVGYYQPLNFYVSIEDGNQTRKQTPEGLGVINAQQVRFRAVGFPIIETYDVLVDPTTDLRYLVKQKEDTNFPGTDLIVVQILDTQVLPPTDPVYKIKITNG